MGLGRSDPEDFGITLLGSVRRFAFGWCEVAEEVRTG